jgi:hypothetical protein
MTEDEKIYVNLTEKRIIDFLDSRKKCVVIRLSTYEVAKGSKLSWTTVDKYGWKMKDKGIIKIEEEFDDLGQKKIFWTLKREVLSDIVVE